LTRPVIWTARARYELEAQAAYVAADSTGTARRLREIVFATTAGIGEYATGRRGRVGGTYEKVVPRLPYIIVYRIRKIDGEETIRILRVIHTSRNWLPGTWP
jgi:toxin ParE1/3/4